MRRYWTASFLGLALMTMNAMAQTNTNTFPNSGNVGIFTMNPEAPLTVNSSNQNAISLGRNEGVIRDINLFDMQGSNNYGIRFNGINPGSYRTSLVSNGAEVFTALQNGSVGIGATTPAAALQVGSGNSNSKLSIPGPYNFENVYLGQYGNGNSGLEFINHSGPSNSYGAKFLANIDTGVQGLQLQVASPASSYETLSYSTAMTILAVGGNVGIGTTGPGAKLEVNGNLKLTAGSGAFITFPDSTTQATAWTGSLCGGDYAETVNVAGDRTKYQPGDVLVISEESGSDVLKSAEPYSTLVTGIYSTKPGVVGRRQTTDAKTSTNEVPMAMVGIVPTKVSAENGPIKRGDLLVTSSKLGYAMKGTDRGRMLGAIVGKALGNLDSGTGIIEVVVTLQ